jgi:DNA-binding PadR family transcriptional regulator
MIDNDGMADGPLTPATFHILVTLADGPTHGYAIKRAVEERTNGGVRLGPGTLYAALARMTDARLVRAHAPARPGVQSGPPSPTYSLTAAGRAALTRELARLEGDVRIAREALGRRGGAA